MCRQWALVVEVLVTSATLHTQIHTARSSPLCRQAGRSISKLRKLGWNSCQHKSATVATCKGNLLSFHFRAEASFSSLAHQTDDSTWTESVIELKKWLVSSSLFRVSVPYTLMFIVKSSIPCSSFHVHWFLPLPSSLSLVSICSVCSFLIRLIAFLHLMSL